MSIKSYMKRRGRADLVATVKTAGLFGFFSLVVYAAITDSKMMAIVIMSVILLAFVVLVWMMFRYMHD